MAKFGRFVCVSVPYLLCIASMICILIVSLAGVTSSGTNISLFKVNTKDFSIAASSVISLDTRGHNDVNALTKAATANSIAGTISSINITAADLGLADYYTVTLWNACGVNGSASECTKPKYNWAKNLTDISAVSQMVQTVGGINVTFPRTFEDSLKTFAVVTKWAEIIYIIAFVTTAIELLVGFFALCSRIGSCATFIVSGISTVFTVTASILATVTASVVVGTANSVGKWYGVSASFESTFLAITWLAAAFSIASGAFWMLSICCCAPGNGGIRGKQPSKARDMLNTPYVGYKQVHDPFQPAEYGAEQQSSTLHPGYGAPMSQVKGSRQSAGAYEPYSHHAV
ncbi:MAG: hypothetical protein M1818_002912 [Claussenomyces sp. TS43310]|nr:MAG: hypothetical protein M1818_002912 [Claussenomyces sp. TS43310]